MPTPDPIIESTVEKPKSDPSIPLYQQFESMVSEKTYEDEQKQPKEEKAEPKEPAAKEPKKEKKPKISEEDAAKATELMAEKLGFLRKKKDEKTDEKKAEETDQTKTEEDKPKEDEKPAKKVKVTRKEPDPDAVEIAATTAAKTVEKALEHLKPQKAAKTSPLEEVEADLTPEEKEELKIFRAMAEDDPVSKHLPEQYLDSIRKITSYQAKWEKENPGEVFDPEDEAHDEFYAQVTPDFDERAFRKAESKLAAQELVAKQDTKRERENAQMRAEMASKELEPVIQNTKLAAAAEILKSFGKGLEKIVEEKGYQAFSEEDPLADHVLKIAASRVAPFIEAARQIDEPKARIPYDEKNPAHRDYVEYLLATEDALKNGSASDRIKDGKRFATRADYLRMTAAQRKNHWFLDDTEMIIRRVQEEAAQAKLFYEKEVERIENIAQKRGYKKDGASQSSQQKKDEKSPKAEEKAKEIKSPESAGSNQVNASQNNNNAGNADFWDSMNKVLFGR